MAGRAFLCRTGPLSSGTKTMVKKHTHTHKKQQHTHLCTGQEREKKEREREKKKKKKKKEFRLDSNDSGFTWAGVTSAGEYKRNRWNNQLWHRLGGISLAAAAASIIFVATSLLLKTSFVATQVGLSRQNYVCRGKSFVATKIRFSRQNICLSRQKYVCRDKKDTCSSTPPMIEERFGKPVPGVCAQPGKGARGRCGARVPECDWTPSCAARVQSDDAAARARRCVSNGEKLCQVSDPTAQWRFSLP